MANQSMLTIMEMAVKNMVKVAMEKESIMAFSLHPGDGASIARL